MPPRANHSAALTVSSLATAQTTVLCRPYVACAWLILTPPHSVLIFITVPMFFPLRFPLPVISKLLREGSKQRKPSANKPWRNAPNARRMRNARGRRRNASERRRNEWRGNERRGSARSARSWNVKRRNAEGKNVETRGARRSKNEGIVKERTDIIVEGKKTMLTVGTIAEKKARKIVAATIPPIATVMLAAANPMMTMIVAGSRLPIVRKAGLINLF